MKISVELRSGVAYKVDLDDTNLIFNNTGEVTYSPANGVLITIEVAEISRICHTADEVKA